MENAITDYYRAKNILITGATGFVGKSLLAKLLRAFPTLGTVYVLVRPKRGVDVDQRARDLLDNPIFTGISAERLQLVVSMHGDITLPHLGLSADDRSTLIEHVNIIMHSAATVKFNEPLRRALLLNTCATNQMLELGVQCKRLCRFVYVSTAYTNVDKRCEIFENVYAPTVDPHELLRLAAVSIDDDDDNDALHVLAANSLQQHPNTYTFSKALAEVVCDEYADRLPIVIVRPSIVLNAWREPFDGWIEHPSGMVGIIMEIARGAVQMTCCDTDVIADLVPVDYVVNTIITATWHDAERRLAIYNCTTGSDNPITWEDICTYVIAAGRKYPSKYLQWYPNLYCTTNKYLLAFVKPVLNYFPALVADVLLTCQGKQALVCSRTTKTNKLIGFTTFFQTNQFAFNKQNMRMLCRHVQKIDVDGDFDLEITKLNWAEYFECCMIKIRELILKDDLSSLPYSRRRLNAFYSFSLFLKLLLILCLYYVFTISFF